jgi:hypothetical protein
MSGRRHSEPTPAQMHTARAICVDRDYAIDASEVPVVDPVTGAYRISLQRKLPSERPLILLIHPSGSYTREEGQ